ncbi:MAG: di-heme oxidoredictase family protein [Cellulophaga sp.]
MKTKTALILIIVLITLSCKDDNGEEYTLTPVDLSERFYAGGGTTVFSATSVAFETPAPNLSAANLTTHLDGDAQFEAAFVTAPAEINSGVGPVFNHNTCIACHPKDGRAAFPSNDINALSGFFLRGSIPGVGEHGGINPVPGFGGQLQNQAIFGHDAEVKFQVVYEEKVEVLADGTKVILRKPTYSIQTSYIAFPSDAMLSPRLAPPVFGLGLLEAITEVDILANQDINDIDGDGISGKANYVWDPFTQKTVIGRFGWKANTSTVLIQSAGAYVEDMGVTNYVFPNETGINQGNGQDGLDDDPEITKAILDQVTLYCRTLGVPAPRDIGSKAVKIGAAIFENIECAKCHIPKQRSGNFLGIDAISNQTFFPYTDMLLHDMGEDLADGRPDFLANGNEWKTRPLWGIGLTDLINGHTDFLHDGRAKNITEAILWHGGEAENAKNNFKDLNTEDRKALLAFLNSL